MEIHKQSEAIETHNNVHKLKPYQKNTSFHCLIYGWFLRRLSLRPP